MDVAFALLLIVLSLPAQLVIAILIKRGSPGPVLYRAERVGRKGKHFVAYKFRTMRVDSGRSGPRITAIDDQRITPGGRWLRDSRLDELPQLWNVLHGEMSLVGPRPEDPYFVAMYTPEQRAVLDVRPGMTGPAQLQFSSEAESLDYVSADDTYARSVLPSKLAVDLEYVRQHTLRGDLAIMLRTAAQVTRGALRRRTEPSR
jgi:lipopolysaccharide/colanic/teichoic acid biosynthesis glycosyltransferase